MLQPQQLAKFGLNEKEARVYLASLRLGPSSVQVLALEASIHRVSTYDIVRYLEQKGFIRTEFRGKKRYFIAAEPEEILDQIRRRQDEFAALAPELKAIKIKLDKPNCSYYEGEGDVWEIFYDLLLKKEELLILGDLHQASRYKTREFNSLLDARLVTGYKIRNIVDKPPGETDWLAMKHQGVIEMKMVENGGHLQGLTIITNQSVLKISFEDSTATLLYDSDNANNQQMIFNTLWNCLPRSPGSRDKPAKRLENRGKNA
ncbi:hypothetical protein HGA64_04905 [Candidatus Falkowbacteria bacterium]|nr:hypothetical protein [Candidatus Falkowbacteria bacterium]